MLGATTVRSFAVAKPAAFEKELTGALPLPSGQRTLVSSALTRRNSRSGNP